MFEWPHEWFEGTFIAFSGCDQLCNSHIVKSSVVI